jgi:glutamate-ammonia-ligase adenylyltransferase
VQVLEGAASAAAAGAAHADLAETCLTMMTEAALEEVARMFGPPAGAVAVLALGKFGGRELAEGSDLDIMVVHDSPEAQGEGAQDGPHDGLSPHEYYTRFTQRLISAISAQTEEGALYEVDMQLRPSGSKGPVAVRFTSFARYYSEEAWTWELQAVTRLRPVTGDAGLGARVDASAKAALMQRRDRAKTLGEVADMRARRERDRPAKSAWNLKLAPGGLVDIEFIAQALQLVAAADAPDALSTNTGAALAQLADAGVLDAGVAEKLRQAFTLYSHLQQALRVCGADGFDPAQAPEALRLRLAAIAGVADFAELEEMLADSRAMVRAAFVDIVGPMGDGSAPLAR